MVTGDIAFSGDLGEYTIARQHLSGLAEALGLPLDAVLTVPGNHDVHRRSIGTLGRMLHDRLEVLPPERVKRIDEILSDGTTAAALHAKLANYNDFSKGLGAQAESDHAPWWRRTVSARLGPVELVGLNTALGCRADDDEKRAVLGERQRHEALRDLRQHEPKDQSLVLALMHHPPSFMCDGPALEAELSLLPHVLLSGHVHDGTGRGRRDFGTDHALFHFSARAAHSDPSETPGHGYASFRLDRDGLTWWPRAWSAKYQTFARAPDFDLDGAGALREPRERLPPHLRRWLDARFPGPSVPRRPEPSEPGALSSGGVSIPPVLEAYQIDRIHQWDLLCRTSRSRYAFMALPSSPQHGVSLFVERMRKELGSVLGAPVQVCHVLHKATAQVAGRDSAAAWLLAVRGALVEALGEGGKLEDLLRTCVRQRRLVLALGPIAEAELENSRILDLVREDLPERLIAIDDDVELGVDVLVLIHEGAPPTEPHETAAVTALMAALRSAKERVVGASVAKLPRLHHPSWELDLEPHLERLNASPHQRREIHQLFTDLIAGRLNYNRFAHLMEAILRYE